MSVTSVFSTLNSSVYFLQIWWQEKRDMKYLVPHSHITSSDIYLMYGIKYHWFNKHHRFKKAPCLILLLNIYLDIMCPSCLDIQNFSSPVISILTMKLFSEVEWVSGIQIGHHIRKIVQNVLITRTAGTKFLTVIRLCTNPCLCSISLYSHKIINTW